MISERNDSDAVKRAVAVVREAGVHLTRLVWCGNDGTVRAKGVSTPRLEERLVGGVGLSRAQPAQNAHDSIADVPGMTPVGEFRLLPDPETLRVLPYAPATAAMLADWIALDGTPEPTCPRELVRRMERRLAERGLAARVGFESEFVLARPVDGGWEPIDRSPCFSTTGAMAAQDAMEALLVAFDQQRIAVDGAHAEGGDGQQEIAFAPGDPLRAADEQVLARETLRGVAASLGMAASVAPKPFPEAAGNGLHVHLSLFTPDGRNAFCDEAAPGGLAAPARHAVAGLLDHLPGLCALTAPSANSYRRLAPSTWSGAWRCWGYDHREAAVRACSPLAGREQQSANIEYKPSDASASPHLAVGALLAAVIDGIDRGAEPAAPADADPAGLTEDRRAELCIEQLPATPADALDALAADEVLLDALGPELARSFIAVRRSEWEVSAGVTAERDCADHFLRY